jgi:hypothetical protein
MNRKIYDIVRNVLSEGSGGMCSECGSRSMVEGECSECGNMYEQEQEECEKCGEPYDIRFGCDCENKSEVKETLRGGQKRIDLNRNNKIDADDFRRLRMGKKHKTETNETMDSNVVYELEVEESPEFNYAAMKARESGKKSFKLGGKSFPVEEDVYELNMNESTGERIKLRESEIVDIIETIVNEEKKKKTKVNNATKSAQSRSKKENDDYISSVVKKMKDYLKVGSKGNFDMEPKDFPKGNGELAKMDKMAYVPSDAVDEYVQNFTAAGLENLDYDEIHPNEDWVTDLIVGSSRTGNNPKWANAVETPVNQARNKIRKDNLLAKIKRKAYNKSPQPILTDKSGSESDKASKIMMKLESTENKVILEDIEKIKNLIDYGKKTQ